MTTYIWRKNRWVDKKTGEPLQKLHSREGIEVPRYILKDLPAYRSPLDRTKIIEGRSARREDLKRNNCREVDPSEAKVAYSHEFAKKKGLPPPEKQFPHLFR